jgi:hypothetical protein
MVVTCSRGGQGAWVELVVKPLAHSDVVAEAVDPNVRLEQSFDGIGGNSIDPADSLPTCFIGLVGRSRRRLRWINFSAVVDGWRQESRRSGRVIATQ